MIVTKCPLLAGDECATLVEARSEATALLEERDQLIAAREHLARELDRERQHRDWNATQLESERREVVTLHGLLYAAQEKALKAETDAHQGRVLARFVTDPTSVSFNAVDAGRAMAELKAWVER